MVFILAHNDDFENELSDFNLIQMVDFGTWSRMVGPVFRSSILDHVYVRDPTVIKNLTSTKPFFGDHLVVEFLIEGPKAVETISMSRDWRRYQK